MTKKILVLDGNPKSRSFCQHLSDLYEIEASEYFNIKRFNLSQMVFNPSLENGYEARQELEPCLVDFQKAILWADHIVIVTPIWWGGIPAKLKGLFDRVFLPDFSFKYEGNNPLPLQLLKGKTSRIIMTMDAPSDYAQEQAAPAIAQLDLYTLQFCGIEKAKINLLDSMISANSDNKLYWETQVKDLASKGE
ncbi:NAD(P)H-dependent oxidoreductase [Pseudoalteromonas denitrificans]|uniref:Putative NADPH-quinone reductase (Modulator of drug activity B) n=1 Tax=Pseudoalteromonas denitrificans DSM 6059 TaxID=1123010 RepID=A0A1I1K8Q8_9GAMM|nr:NAD(P)H-dependent oxidoreductase [Pseudoalteromonas denitrificans]SFC57269.1 Putative NADPH-quinone reductase (modulator of drug activity B) [Pseudoalteromonas denitrificans DSM 6059]